MSTLTQNPLLVRISRNYLSATIEVRDDAERSIISQNDVVSALAVAKVPVSDEVARRVAEFVEAVHSPDGLPEGRYEIAVGRPLIEGEDGTFTWEDSLQEQTTDCREDESVDFYNISSIMTVEEDTLLGWISPPKPGTEGMDVRGNTLRPKRRPKEVSLKNGVRLDEDGRSVFATVPGKVVYKNNELFIDEVVEVRGNVDFETGNLDLTTDVVIRGSIQDLFRVKTKKNLTVWGSIEAAEVEVAGNVTVRGGILNHSKGKVVAGGEIVAKFCDEANLEAQGDIHLGKEAINSRVHTEGKLTLSRGAVIGGQVHARYGIEVKTLGSVACVRTEIIVGLHPDELRKIAETSRENAKRRTAMGKLHHVLNPLIANSKRLNQVQREQATELMGRVATIEMEMGESEQEVAELVRLSREAKPYVLVNSMIHPGVTITLNDRVVTVSQEIKGPIKIEKRKIKNYMAIAAVNQLTGSVYELPAHEVDLTSERAADDHSSHSC